MPTPMNLRPTKKRILAEAIQFRRIMIENRRKVRDLERRGSPLAGIARSVLLETQNIVRAEVLAQETLSPLRRQWSLCWRRNRHPKP